MLLLFFTTVNKLFKYTSLPPPQHHHYYHTYSICHRRTSNEIHNAHLYNTTRVIQLEILQHFRVQNPHATNYFWAFAGTIVIQNFGGSTREKCFRVARSDYVFFLRVAAGRFTYVSGGNFALRDTSCGNIGGRGYPEAEICDQQGHVSFRIQRFFQCKELPNDADCEHL